MAKYMGVDLSFNNTAVDYKRLKAATIDGGKVKFAMLRTAYGCFKDTYLDRHYKGCKEAGIYVGAYHWLRAQTPVQARQEAQWLCNLLKSYQFDYPIALDFEDGDLFALGLSKEQYSAIIDAFMAVLKAANYYVVLYTNPDTIQKRITAATLKKYDLWLAHWTHGAKPYQYGQTMWQYAAYGTAADVENQYATDIGTVDGAGGPIDVDVAYVGYAAKIRKLGMNKPVEKYRVTGTKTVQKSALAQAQGQLKALGFEVEVEEI
ncbi:MAG: GH25 family lysozyme [Oscillospiraceae bacterium]